MIVRCKLTLVEKAEVWDYGYKHSTTKLKFQAVSGSDPEDENTKFFASTPTADIQFYVANEQAADYALQDEFYLDMERVPQADALLAEGVEGRELPAGCIGVFRVDSFTHQMGTLWHTGNDGKQTTERGILVAMKLYPPHHRPPGEWPFKGGKIEFGSANLTAVRALELDKLYWANLLPATPANEKPVDFTG